ncbi:DUF6297 family protein [Quadrisphaera sp. DSM 44207]|uniref:DUF6297 family protein n=1 Tax=Quadrisphaera sp. DSM 44207 TaxID=1881057 RepID=UPI00115F8822|nr:DUF6297 family protein [Quadrisphaera sp. DSM 44207]
MALVLSSAMVLSVSAETGAGAAARPAPPGAGLDPGWITLLLALATLAALAGLAARLGPVSLSAPEAAWWLPLPADRRSLLRPAVLRWPAAAAVLGAPLGAATALALAPAPGLRVLALSAVAGAGTASAVVLGLGLAQAGPTTARRARTAADVALGAVPLAGVLLALAGAELPAPVEDGVLAAAAAAVLLAGVLAAVLDRRSCLIRDAALRERGSVTGQALEAVLSLDTRALGRALTERTQRSQRRTSASMPWLARAPRAWRPALALITSDALLLARTPRHLVQLAATACLAVAAVAVAQPSPWLTVGAVLVGAYAAALATADGARQAQVVPVLDALLPLGQHAVRRCRLVVPTLVLVGWSLVVFAAVAGRSPGGGEWLLLGALAAPVWAAAAVRAAYRALPDFAGPLVSTPMGAVPPGAGAVLAQGPDLAVVGSVPVVVALLVASAPPLLLAAQAALALAALAAVARPPRPTRASRSRGPAA